MTHRLEMMGQQKYTGLTVLNPNGGRHFNGVVKCHGDELRKPLSWKKPRRIFVNSMSDTFHRDVPMEFISEMFDVMATARWHTFQVLTKRPEIAAEVLPRLAARHTAKNGSGWPLPNVWIGTSVEDQKRAHERIPHLMRCPAAVRFLSIEPMLGPIDLRGTWGIVDGTTVVAAHGVDWVIVGGESGPGARPMHPQWARSIRDQCVRAGVAFFFKQWGEYQPLSTIAARQELPFGNYVIPNKDSPGFGFIKKGKAAAGRSLDGREWSEFPTEATQTTPDVAEVRR